jgi:hypothetical protein
MGYREIVTMQIVLFFFFFSVHFFGFFFFCVRRTFFFFFFFGFLFFSESRGQIRRGMFPTKQGGVTAGTGRRSLVSLLHDPVLEHERAHAAVPVASETWRGRAAAAAGGASAQGHGHKGAAVGRRRPASARPAIAGHSRVRVARGGDDVADTRPAITTSAGELLSAQVALLGGWGGGGAGSWLIWF